MNENFGAQSTTDISKQVESLKSSGLESALGCKGHSCSLDKGTTRESLKDDIEKLVGEKDDSGNVAGLLLRVRKFLAYV